MYNLFMIKKAEGKLKDKINDKFYTKSHVIKRVMKWIDIDKYDYIVEPGAGGGAFLDFLPESTVAYDIEPEDKRIKKANWFERKIPKKYKSALVIGNPPFGKSNDLSKKFICHALKFENVQTIAFVLPDVFRKHTNQKIFPKEFKIKKIIKIPKNAFTLSGQEHHVPCSFFIIEKNYEGRDLRQNHKKISKDFSFGTKHDFDFFIFGAAPKKIIKSPNKNNRGYFIKSNIDKEKLLTIFKQINWKGYSGANGGVYWLTRIDIVENYNKTKRKLRRQNAI